MGVRRCVSSALVAGVMSGSVLAVAPPAQAAVPRPVVIGMFVPNGEGLAPVPLTAGNINLIRHRPGMLPSAHYSWGWVTGSMYLSMQETKLLALGGTVASWLRPWTVVAGRSVAILAGVGVATGRCVVFRVSPWAPTFIDAAGYYRGRWCQ